MVNWLGPSGPGPFCIEDTMTLKITKHWFEGVERVKTNKISSGTIVPKFIILHYTAGWTFEGDLHTLTKSSRKASTQLLIGRDARTVQMGGFNRRMWHAGPSKSDGYKDINSHGIGIELTNIGWLKKVARGVWEDPYGQRLNAAGEFLGKTRPPMESDVPINEWVTGRHFNNGSGDFSWEPFAEEQLDALDSVVAALLKKYPTIEYIRGHDEIDTRGWKTDPGLAFPLRRYTRLLEDRGEATLPEDSEMPAIEGIKRLEPRDPGFLVFRANTEATARSHPSMEGFPLGVVPVKNGVNVTDQNGNWYFGKFFDENKEWKVGWIHNTLLTPTAGKM